jgi:hypothetical protein
MMQVVAVLPVRGRPEQTLQYAQRLRATAGMVGTHWVAVGAQPDQVTLQALADAGWITACVQTERITYWNALAWGSSEKVYAAHIPFVVTLANDLLGGPQWLERGMQAYRERFGDTSAMMGFNGDGHGPEHSCHFIIHRGLLSELGGWPAHYRHNFGDTELCLRAQQLGRYAKAPYAILFHDHPWVSAGQDDEVYAAGRANWAEDQALFEARKARGWT